MLAGLGWVVGCGWSPPYASTAEGSEGDAGGAASGLQDFHPTGWHLNCHGEWSAVDRRTF